MGNDSGEPSIGANWKSGNIMFQAIFDTMRVTFGAGAPVWVLKDGPNTSITTLDRILFTDSRTGRTFVSQLLGTTRLSAFTDNDGDSYTVSQGSGIASGIDHQTIGGGAFRTCTPLQQAADPV